MAHGAADSSTTGGRAACTVLSLIAKPLCVPVLRAHLDGPLGFPDLRKRMGEPAPAALRRQLDSLRKLRALERHVLERMPYTVDNELTGVGRTILETAEVAEAWLGGAPQGGISLGTEPAKDVLAALAAGWESGILDALASEPASLTEISSLIPELSYPSLERRLQAMRAAHLVEMHSQDRRGKPYALTEWTRQAAAFMAAASRCGGSLPGLHSHHRR